MNRIRIFVSVVMVFTSCLVSAQTIDSIPNHYLGLNSSQTTTFMEMSDGSLLGGILMADESQGPYIPIGYVLQKVRRENVGGLEISDTLFMPYEHFPYHLTVKDPLGNGNILAEFYSDYDEGSCNLKIRRFDDNLHFDTMEVIVPLAHFLGSSAVPGLSLDPNGDLVLSYHNSSYDFYSTPPMELNFVRIGLDGTIKHQATADLTIRAGTVYGSFIFSRSPLEYLYWGESWNSQIKCFVLDSLFNVTNSYNLPKMSGAPDNVTYSSNSYKAKLLGLDEGCFMAARSYYRVYNMYPHIEDDGVEVMKYDSSLNLLAMRKFLSEPYMQYVHYGATPIGLEKSRDGYIYFSYFTHLRWQQSQVSVVKMDSDLNIIWQRHCLDREYGRDFGKMIVLDDNSVAVMGINTLDETGYVDHTEVFYIIVHDDYDGMEEQGITIRPYACWPNPARNELHLRYSPDVRPKQIELYDLQGRLVRSQSTGLECLNMEGLAVGTYTMRVSMEGGKVFSDKVVKE